MAGFNFKGKRFRIALAVLVISLGYLYWLNSGSHSTQNFSPEIMARSRQIAAELESKADADLTFDEQLSLMHACSNLQKDNCVLRIGYLILDGIKDLPKERQKPFLKMIEAARKRQRIG